MSDSTALFDAIASGDTAKVVASLAGDPSLASARDEEGRSAILLAAYHRRPEIVAALRAYRRGLDLFEASAIGDLSAVRGLIEKDPDMVESISPDGFGALGLAAFFGHEELVDYLTRAGCDPNRASTNASRVTPLHSAVANPDEELSLAIARRLLDGGADPDVRQAGGWTPIHSAAAHGRLPLTKLLLERGADPSPRSEDGRTPADMARENGHHEVLRLFA